MLLFYREKRGKLLFFIYIDFAGNNSSEPLRKEVISKKRDLNKPFLSASEIFG
jgi:hypothetical protein